MKHLLKELNGIIAELVKGADFVSPLNVLDLEHELTNEELIRAIRFAISAEYEAIQIYTQIAHSTDNKKAKKILIAIANEERVHAGELLKLLKVLNPTEETFYKEGEKEVKDLLTLTR